MASVRIRIDDFEDGVLPEVCASSGAPSERLYKTDISSRTPGWVWLCVLGGPFGIALALVLAAVLRKTAHGYLPSTDEVQARLQVRSRLGARCFVASIALLVVGLLLATTAEGFGPLGAVIMGVAAVSALVAAFLFSNVPGSVGGHLDSTSRWVELEPVSPWFVAAYDAQESARRAERRAQVDDRYDVRSPNVPGSRQVR